ncbi:MAG: MDR family MFS transporter [Mycobacteriaceae bacterium]
MSTETARWSGIGFRSERGPVLIALMLSTALVALDSTIIATAVPSMVRDLGGFSQFPWLFSLYLLAQAVSVPIYGKLADQFGRRPVLYFGIGLFLLGSVLCGFAWSMPALIAARAVQGLGAGAVQPMGITIAGDLYSVAERARVQGYLASVWGAAAVVGPTLGGVFSEYLSWRWIFFVNLPIGAVAVWMLHRHLHETVHRRKHTIDYAGAVLLTVGCSLLILGLLEGGVSWSWGSPVSVGILVLGAILVGAFVLVEKRAAEPVLPLWVFTRRVLTGSSLVAVGVGAVVIGLSSYVPTYAQGVLGSGPVVAGFAVAALTLGWPLAAALAGRVYLRIGFRDTALIGMVFVLAGAVLMLGLGAGSGVWEVAGACFTVGVGLGLVSSPTVVAAQSVVGWERRGVVTGTNMFSRSLGSAVGVAVLGAVANAVLAHRYTSAPDALAGQLPVNSNGTSAVLDGSAESTPALHEFVRVALSDATHYVFLSLAVVAVLMVGAVLLMPRRTRELTFL